MNSFNEMMHAGTDGIEILSAAACAKLAKGKDVLLVDIRDPRERERDGCVASAYSMPRGMLEFWMHKDSPYYKSVFGKYTHFIFICAKGWRALRAARRAERLASEPPEVSVPRASGG